MSPLNPIKYQTLSPAPLPAPMALSGASRRKRIPGSLPALLALVTGMAMTVQPLIAGNRQELNGPDFHWEDYRFVRDKPIPGGKWEDSAPIGNGHLGARISGNPGAERIYFNLATYWQGGPWNDPNPKEPGTGGMWARARDGDKAVDIMRTGNFPGLWQQNRASGAIPEMVLQCHAGEIDILPALPSCWPEGRVAGIRARGGFTLDIAWQESKPSKVTIRSTLGEDAVVRCPGAKTTVTSGGKTIEAERVSTDVIRFKTEKNADYVLGFSGS